MDMKWYSRHAVLTPDEPDWAGTYVYSVRVIDESGLAALDFTDFFVWNHVIATDSTDSGIIHGIQPNIQWN